MASEIGGDIDGVRHHQQTMETKRKEKRLWHLSGEIAGKATARGPADTGTDDLNRHHERQRQQHCPGQATSAELPARLGVGGKYHWGRRRRTPVMRPGTQRRPASRRDRRCAVATAGSSRKCRDFVLAAGNVRQLFWLGGGRKAMLRIASTRIENAMPK